MSERPAFDDLDALARLLDARFRIPFTNVRFGLDGLGVQSHRVMESS